MMVTITVVMVVMMMEVTMVMILVEVLYIFRGAKLTKLCVHTCVVAEQHGVVDGDGVGGIFLKMGS